MRQHRRISDVMQVSGRRIAIHVAVIGVHLAAWLVCFHGTVPEWRSARTPISQRPDRLRVRLVPAALAPARMARATHAHPAHAVRAQLRIKPAPVTSPTPALPTHERVMMSPGPTVPDYVAGGGLLHGRSPTSATVRLPGSATPIVQGFHMTDPRMQGIGGAVRTLQAMFGVTDPHCVDVEVWRGMTPVEQLARHISASDVERTAQEYHCGPG